MTLKLGLAAGLICLAAAGSAFAQSTTPPLPPGVSGGTTVITRPDGTRIETTVLGPTSLRVVITGGPVYGPNPVTVNFTNITTSGTTQTYTGDVTQGGATSPFTCNLDTATGTVTGSGACADVLSGSSTTPPTPPTPTPPTTPTPTPPTDPTPPPPTPPPTTPAEPTMVAPDGTVITVATGNLLLLTAVQTDQFLNSLLGDALNSTFGQAFVAARMQVLQAGGGRGRFAAADGYRGLSAGESDTPIGAWVNVEGVRLKDDRLGRDMDGGAKSAALGFDYLFSTSAVLGVFAAYGDTDIDGPDAGYESKGWTGGAYGSVLVTPQVSVTGVVGVSKHNVTNSRTFGILSSTGDTDREQVFGSVTVEGQLPLAENWVLRPAASVFLSDSETDAYVDDAGRAVAGFENKLSIARAGATLMYQAERISPYVSAAWDHYLSDEFGADGDYGRIGAGVAVSLTSTTYVSIGASTTVGKKDERETLFGFTLGGRF